MLFSRHLHKHVDVRRGAEIGCSPTASLARQRPQKRRTKIRQASEPVRQQRLTHPVCTSMQQRSLMRLGMHLRDGSAIRFMGNESFACSRRALSRPSRAR
jgi:hypothetical protein